MKAVKQAGKAKSIVNGAYAYKCTSGHLIIILQLCWLVSACIIVTSLVSLLSSWLVLGGVKIWIIGISNKKIWS